MPRARPRRIPRDPDAKLQNHHPKKFDSIIGYPMPLLISTRTPSAFAVSPPLLSSPRAESPVGANFGNILMNALTDALTDGSLGTHVPEEARLEEVDVARAASGIERGVLQNIDQSAGRNRWATKRGSKPPRSSQWRVPGSVETVLGVAMRNSVGRWVSTPRRRDGNFESRHPRRRNARRSQNAAEFFVCMKVDSGCCPSW